MFSFQIDCDILIKVDETKKKQHNKVSAYHDSAIWL